MADFKITSGPSEAEPSGRWRLLETFPETTWRAKLLALSQETPEGRALDLVFDSENSLLFTCHEDREALRLCMRLISELVARTNRAVSAT